MRLAAPPVAVLRRPELLQPYAAHRLAQRRRPGRAGHRHPLPVPVPRRPDRRALQSLLVQGEIIAGAIAASATVETDRITIDPDRLLELQAGESSGRTTTRRSNSRSIRSASRRCCAGSCRRPRPGRASMTATASCSSTAAASRPRRRPALRSAAATPNGPAVSSATGSTCAAGCSRATCRSTASSGRRTAGAIRRSPRRSTAEGQHRARQRPRRGDRFGGGAGPALPRRARRAAAVDPGRRHRSASPPSAADRQVFLVLLGVMVVLSILLARTIAGPVRGSPTPPRTSAGASARASRSPTLPTGATKSGTCPERCAT